MSHPHWFRTAKHVFEAVAGVFVEKKSGRALNFDGVRLPRWFDVGVHALIATGIIERATGVHLAEDGLPAHGIRRAAALAAADKVEDALGIVAVEAIEAALAKLTADKAAEEVAAVEPQPETPEHAAMTAIGEDAAARDGVEEELEDVDDQLGADRADTAGQAADETQEA